MLGNMGALLLGVAGRVEDGLDAINRCIARFSEARIVANPLYAGQLLSFSKPLCATGDDCHCIHVIDLAANRNLGLDKSLGAPANSLIQNMFYKSKQPVLGQDLGP